jgi:alpha-L-fucosidase
VGKGGPEIGLRFGVSEHLGHGFTFMQPAHGSDKKGPMAGVPYDGANPAYWDLYQMPAKPGDSGWYSSDPRWAQEWYARMYDLIDQYKPDLLYSDGGLPFGSVGRNIVAQLYNVSIENNGGKLEAVYNCKKNYFDMSPFVDGTCVQDCERGIMTDIQPYPWQTDTSTGDWFYNKHDGYKSSSEVIHTLTDIVSKNGNLLLNVVLYPDGSLPPQMETFLSEMADWMKINGEAIFGTKPWVVCGEGSTTVKGGTFDNESFPFTAKDIRFTRKGNDIYATTLGLPSGQTVIRALASNSPLVSGNPTQVSLLGATENLKWTRTTDGMVIQLPDTMPCKAAVSFKISGLTTNDVVDPNALSAFKEILSAPALSEAGPDGSFQLPAAEARLHGSTIRIDGSGDSSNIGWWQKPEDTVSWRLKVAKPGTYNVSINMASQDADSEFVVAVDSEQLEGKSTNTGGYYRYQTVDVGTIMIENAGATTITIRPKSPASWKPFNVRSVILKPE